MTKVHKCITFVKSREEEAGNAGEQPASNSEIIRQMSIGWDGICSGLFLVLKYKEGRQYYKVLVMNKIKVYKVYVYDTINIPM